MQEKEYASNLGFMNEIGTDEFLCFWNDDLYPVLLVTRLANGSNLFGFLSNFSKRKIERKRKGEKLRKERLLGKGAADANFN